ncbi:MAG: hypothetical protein EBW34_01970 [Burkholderiaceae bacterium]|nr:hypothetical protein [Burkholderiaceae bacterium]
MAFIPARIHTIAAWLVRIEATFLFGLGAYLLLRTLTSSVEELDAVIAEIIFLILGGIGLFFAGRGFLQHGDRLALGLILGTYAFITFIAALASIPRSSTK